MKSDTVILVDIETVKDPAVLGDWDDYTTALSRWLF